MNDRWTWEGSPKNGFNRRRLERCWNLPDKKEPKDTTYRNKGVGQKVIGRMGREFNTVERIKPMKVE